MPDEPKLLATSRGPSLFGFGHEVLLARINKIAPLYMRIKNRNRLSHEESPKFHPQ